MQKHEPPMPTAFTCTEVCEDLDTRVNDFKVYLRMNMPAGDDLDRALSCIDEASAHAHNHFGG